MDKLKELIYQHSRWQTLEEYIRRIETYKNSEFSICVENSKSLLESIGKEICKIKGIELKGSSSVSGVIKNAFKALGYSSSDNIRQISTSLASIGQCIGEIRNVIGTTAHGKTLQEIEKRNDVIDDITKEFLIESVELVSCLLINLAEKEFVNNLSESEISYDDFEDFNQYWDDMYGEFKMGDYSYDASDILFNMDYDAYKLEKDNYFNEIKEAEYNEENE